MIRREKGIELIIFYIYNQFKHIWFQHVFDPENYGFWKCDLHKNYSYVCDERHECMIHMI
jgi:hypothetical protein